MLKEKGVDTRFIDIAKHQYYKMMKKNLDDKFGVYLNYMDHSVQNWKQLYFGKNYAKLQQIKATYDPNDVFKRNYVAIEANKKTEANYEDL